MQRRDFITNGTLAILSTFTSATNANDKKEHNRNPLLQRIDTSKLGSKGEITVGFLLTLNPRPCASGKKQLNSKESSQKAITDAFRHLTIHGIKPNHIIEAVKEAQAQWKKAKNSNQISPQEP